MKRQGLWFLSSETNPEWNSSGRAVVGMFEMPQEVIYEIERLKSELGEPPKDLEWGYWKD